MEGAHDIGEHEGSSAGQWFGKYGGQSGECIGGANSDARDSATGEDKNCSERVDVILDLNGNTLLMELVLLDTAGVG